MIVAAVDDLLFSSKLRNAARHAGVDLAIARNPEAVIEQARASKASLVILDLDAARLRPLDTLAQLAAAPDLAAFPTLGFVSHVHTGTIQAAQRAGIGSVLARSAFVASLPNIMASAR
jgi:DNA-binding NarL/FixJ family response regulator